MATNIDEILKTIKEPLPPQVRSALEAAYDEDGAALSKKTPPLPPGLSTHALVIGRGR